MAYMEVKDIMDVLPHRYPMLLVDRILESDEKEYIVGLKNLTINEPFFQGHFPGDPIMPGVYQLEAMAQVAGLLVNQITKRAGAIAYFVAVDNARFRRILRPGDQLRMEIRVLRFRMGMCKVHGQIIVDGEVASEADLIFGRKD